MSFYLPQFCERSSKLNPFSVAGQFGRSQRKGTHSTGRIARPELPAYPGSDGYGTNRNRRVVSPTPLILRIRCNYASNVFCCIRGAVRPTIGRQLASVRKTPPPRLSSIPKGHFLAKNAYAWGSGLRNTTFVVFAPPPVSSILNFATDLNGVAIGRATRRTRTHRPQTPVTIVTDGLFVATCRLCYRDIESIQWKRPTTFYITDVAPNQTQLPNPISSTRQPVERLSTLGCVRDTAVAT